MYKYIIKRILIAIPVLIGITVIDYAIMCMAGSPLEMMQGPRVSQAALEAKKIALGWINLYVQYFVWLGQLLHGNLGYSIKSSQAVSEMIASHLGPTLLLMGVSLIASLILAVPAGIYSAIHQYEKGDYAVVTASFLGSSIPGFFLSLLLIYVFTVKLGWLPSKRYDDARLVGRCEGHCGAYGHAGARARLFHGGQQHRLHPKRCA